MGAFKDAFWLWRDEPCPDGRASLLVESPMRCLLLLAVTGALCIAIALLLPAARPVLLSSLCPRNLVMLTAAENGDAYGPNGFLNPKPSVSRERFERLKAFDGGQFSELAFYVSRDLPVETPNGKQTIRVAKTTPDLFRLLNIPLERRAAATSRLVLTSSVWRAYFGSDPQYSVIPDAQWNLPARVDGWVIEDRTAIPAQTLGFAVGRLSGKTFHDIQFRFIRLADRSLEMSWSVLAIFLFAYVLVLMMTSIPERGHLRGIGVRRGAFLTAKTLLMMPIVMFGSLDLGSLGQTVSPVFLDVAMCGSIFAVRWILADQRKRCPVCLRLLGNPVRIGEPSRIFLEWHGTELMCRRGHGLLYVPEWPAIWCGHQRWMGLGESWDRQFP